MGPGFGRECKEESPREEPPRGLSNGRCKLQLAGNKRGPLSCVISNLFLHYFPAFCKTGGRKILELLLIRCRHCGEYFFICRRCYRGHIYCSVACRKKGYRKRHREAQKRYRDKDEKKKLRSEAEQKRRYQKWSEAFQQSKNQRNKANEGGIAKILSSSHRIARYQRESFFTSGAQVSHGGKKLFLISADPGWGNGKRGETKGEEEDNRAKNEGIAPVGTVNKCAFCGCEGVIVDKFSRRGYGKGNKHREWNMIQDEVFGGGKTNIRMS